MSETALLTAVRHQIVTRCGYTDQQVEIELDDMIPPLVGDVFVLVGPGEWGPGDANNTSGGVLDELFSVDVTVILRAAKVPKDRRRGVLIDNLDGLNVRLRKIVSAIGNFSYDLMNEANAILANATGAEGFVEPLRFRGMSKPRVVPSEHFSARAGEPQAGIERTARFGGARRIQVLTTAD